ncbi:ornithine decarboxylase-like [Pomacea canaliculata]|uniref:ornithine decarboxylase-like n=1 Tax=Pomacea canaliculata TaxID=400727 RepID=UPI000D736B00|nr:ornithine decarboxylase-like [Pomacea canaliculata]
MVENGNKKFRYFLNDGVLGSFLMYVILPTVKLTVEPLHAPTSPQKYKCSLWGPTCAGIDLIRDQVDLPEMKVGDYLCFRNMGYYTISLYNGFNGMPMPEVFLYCAEDIWMRVFPEKKRLHPTSCLSLLTREVYLNGVE